jgi:hypothetical protein
MPVSRSRPRLKLIAIGFNTYGTGLTRVMHGIMRRLADRHEIHYLGIGYTGETVRDRGLTIHPTNPRGGDIFAAFQAKTLIEEIDPALVFILHDIWPLRVLPAHPRALSRSAEDRLLHPARRQDRQREGRGGAQTRRSRRRLHAVRPQ